LRKMTTTETSGLVPEPVTRYILVQLE